jgi:hypothetical protein
MTDTTRTPGKNLAADRPQEPAIEPIWVQIGGTEHFQISYMTSMGEAGRKLAETLRETAERDYEWLRDVFGCDVAPDPDSGKSFLIYLGYGHSGGRHATCRNPQINLDVFDLQHPRLVRYFMLAKMSDVFEAQQNKGWDCGTQDSQLTGAVNGAALSLALAADQLPDQLEVPELGVSNSVVHYWLDSARPDYLTDNYGLAEYQVALGCGVLFVNYLHTQLSLPWATIVQQGAASTLAQTFLQVTPREHPYEELRVQTDVHYPRVGPSYALAPDNPWTGARALGFETGLEPGAGSPVPGRVDVFARDDKSFLWHRWFDGVTFWPTDGWEKIGFQSFTEPMVVYRRGLPEIFATDNQRYLYRIYLDTSGTKPVWVKDPLKVPCTLKAGACVTGNAGQTIDLFAVVPGPDGQDHRLLHNYHDGVQWEGWEDLGLGGCTSAPSAVSRNGLADVAVLATGADGNGETPTVRHYSQADQTWSALGGVDCAGGPEMVSWGPSRLDILVRDTDNQLRQRTFDGGWQPAWGGAIATGLDSAPRATASAPERIDAVWAGPDSQGRETVWHEFWDGSSWGTKVPLPLTATAQPVIAVSRGPGMLDLITVGGDRMLHLLRWA